ncbi:PAS domain-containing protein [Sagittula sp. S175]|uniref:PAS domain-containing protein n=1 Tax=Sagittula sp. S175 TaxID=3415129 RepID=UPI003C7CAE0E
MFGKGGNGQGIVSMTEREKSRREAPLRQVEAYWRGLCDGTSVPLRSQVDPRGMESALENAFLMERIAPSMAKIRVAGTHLNDLMGMQVAGMPLSSLIAPSDRERFGQGITALFADPAIIRMDLKAEGGFGKPDMEASLILLPLRSDFGDLTRGLGALISHGRIGRTPRRFKVERLHISPALEGVASQGIVTREKIELTEDRPSLAFHEQRTPYRPKVLEGLAEKPPAKSGAPFLRLVVDND